MDLFIYVFAALFSVLNPLGAIPIFVGLTQDDSKQERSRISIWAAINVFIILTISYFVGKYALAFFGISIDSLRIAGGIVIVTSGFALLTGNFSKKYFFNGHNLVSLTFFLIFLNFFSFNFYFICIYNF